MNKAERIKTFEVELGLIGDGKVREFVELCLEHLPDYVFSIPASSTGKYHPAFSLNNGGLIRHTQCAVRIAHELLNLEMYRCLMLEKPYIIAALILHDGLKSGNPKQAYTVHDHPILISKFINQMAQTPSHQEIAKKICPLVETHMGQWRTGRGSSVTLPTMETKEQKFVHQADYLASRKTYDYFYEV